VGVSRSRRVGRMRACLLLIQSQPRWPRSARSSDSLLWRLWSARHVSTQPAWSWVIASHVTSSCWLSATTSSWALNLQLGAERIAGVGRPWHRSSGRTILRWVQKFGPALSEEIRRCRKPVSATWLADEAYVKILGKWHCLYPGVDDHGQVLDCGLSRTPPPGGSRSLLLIVDLD